MLNRVLPNQKNILVLQPPVPGGGYGAYLTFEGEEDDEKLIEFRDICEAIRRQHSEDLFICEKDNKRYEFFQKSPEQASFIRELANKIGRIIKVPVVIIPW